MPSRFPFLKSKTEPYGLIEQFGIAVTIDSESDPSDNPDDATDRSWFGATLFNGLEHAADKKDVFVFSYTNEDGTKTDTIPGYKITTQAYADGRLLCTAYDWGLTSLKIDTEAKTGEVEGGVRLKGHCDLFVNNKPKFRGRHLFRYAIVQVGKEWLIKEWSLKKEKKKKANEPDPLGEFLDALL